MKKKKKMDLVRVIYTTRDASKDRWIERRDAESLYNKGLLSIDVTNSGTDEGTVYYINEKSPELQNKKK